MRSERFRGVLEGDGGVVVAVVVAVDGEVFFMKGERIGGFNTVLGI